MPTKFRPTRRTHRLTVQVSHTPSTAAGATTFGTPPEGGSIGGGWAAATAQVGEEEEGDGGDDDDDSIIALVEADFQDALLQSYETFAAQQIVRCVIIHLLVGMLCRHINDADTIAHKIYS